MSRNEMFFLLACAFVAAIMSGAPAPIAHQSPMTIASLFPAAPVSEAWVQTNIAQHSFDRQ